MASEDALSPAAEEFLYRKLCPDGGCIGILDSSGVCKECGLVGAEATTDPRLRGMRKDELPEAAVPTPPPAEAHPDRESLEEPADFASRQLCPDGACIGIVNASGVCGECGAVA